MAKELITSAAAWKSINELFGGEARHPDQVESVETFTTRSPALDRALQVGGWARGRIYQIAGKPSSGKTFLALIAMVEWQSKDPKNCCCFIDAEFTYDPVWAASLGIDNDRVLLIKSNDAKTIFTGLLGVPKVNKTTKKVIRIPGLLKMIEAGQIIKHTVGGKSIELNLGKMGIIVLDSIASMQVPQEAQSEVGKINVATLSRFLTAELKSLTPAIALSNVCFVGINHLKVGIGMYAGTSTPGGSALSHACSVKLSVSSLSGVDNMILDSNQEKIGHKVRIKVDKNKLGRPHKKAEFFIDFTRGVTMVSEQILETGVLEGVITRPNNRTYIINGNSITSKSLALEYIEKNKGELEGQIREQYMNNDHSTEVIEEMIMPDTIEGMF